MEIRRAKHESIYSLTYSPRNHVRSKVQRAASPLALSVVRETIKINFVGSSLTEGMLVGTFLECKNYGKHESVRYWSYIR